MLYELIAPELTANAFIEEEEDLAEIQLNEYFYFYNQLLNDEKFHAMEYRKNSGTYYLHHSTRNEGYMWQLSFIAYDGIPTSHRNYKDIKTLLHSMELPFCTNDNKIKVKVLMN